MTEDKVEVSREVLDLIAGLDTMANFNEIDVLLSRIEILSRLIEKTIMAEEYRKEADEEIICDSIAWQKKLTDEIRHTLWAQCTFVWKLRMLIGDQFNGDKIDANDRCVRALRSLAGLFQDEWNYSDSAEISRLKAWSISWGFDFEKVKDLLTSDPPSFDLKRKASDPQPGSIESEAKTQVTH